MDSELGVMEIGCVVASTSMFGGPFVVGRVFSVASNVDPVVLGGSSG